MNTTIILIGFSLAVLMGAGVASLLATIKPDWSLRRRQLTAAAVLPAITAAMTLLGIVVISTADHGASESMEDLAIAALATVGAGSALVALVGGLVGATIAGRRRG